MTLFRSIPWETRNLGIPSYEINVPNLNLITATDLVNELDLLHKKYSHFFIFARLQKKEIHLSAILEKQGFYLIESTISPYMNLNKNVILAKFNENKKLSLPKRYKEKNITFHTLTNDEKLHYKNKLKKIAEESFSYDRFHLDFNCTSTIADRRFSLWVDDLIADNNVTFDALQHDDEPISFIARKNNHLILGGFKKKYHLAGLGEYFILSTCSTIKQQNHPTLETLISVNNLPIVNLYASVGFKFRDTRYSFHFWNK